jgi:hypothetical protein
MPSKGLPTGGSRQLGASKGLPARVRGGPDHGNRLSPGDPDGPDHGEGLATGGSGWLVASEGLPAGGSRGSAGAAGQYSSSGTCASTQSSANFACT